VVKDSLTESELDDILAGKKKTVKVDSIWDLKKDHAGRLALFNRIGGMRTAMPHLTATDREPEEFHAALKIIKQIKEAIDVRESADTVK